MDLKRTGGTRGGSQTTCAITAPRKGRTPPRSTGLRSRDQATHGVYEDGRRENGGKGQRSKVKCRFEVEGKSRSCQGWLDYGRNDESRLF